MTSLICRKTQRIKNTLFVSLPQQWAIDKGLSKGDLLTFELQEDDRLLVDLKRKADD